MRSKKNPFLYVLPEREVLRPSWEEKVDTPTMSEQAIRKQMDKLHKVSNAVFIVVILLEICICQIAAVTDSSLTNVLTALMAAIAVGLLGGVLYILTASIEKTVRQHLSSTEWEGDENV